MRRAATVVVLVVYVLAFGRTASAQDPGTALGPVVAIAHRGASSYRPEHTFLAYDLAVAQDVDFIECDLQLTEDEVLVCVHDETVDRTSDGSGRVDEFTLAELRELDWGSWFDAKYAGASIVPFEEQLDCYLGLNPRLRFHVETKGPDTYGGRMEQRVVELLAAKGLLDTGGIQSATVVIQSFDPESLQIIDELAPTLPTALLWPSFSGSPSPELAAVNAQFLVGELPPYADAAAPNSTALLSDPTMVERFHANGHEVHTWTVDDPDDMRTLLDAGVDGIFTNQPDVLRAAIDDHGGGTTPPHRGNPNEFARGCPGVAGSVTGPPGAPAPQASPSPSPTGTGTATIPPPSNSPPGIAASPTPSTVTRPAPSPTNSTAPASGPAGSLPATGAAPAGIVATTLLMAGGALCRLRPSGGSE